TTAGGPRCTDVHGDPTNCGGCGITCANGQSCQNGVCACDSMQTNCGGTCRVTSFDPDNCGTCANVCPAGSRFCNGGTCQSLASPVPPSVAASATAPASTPATIPPTAGRARPCAGRTRPASAPPASRARRCSAEHDAKRLGVALGGALWARCAPPSPPFHQGE